MAVFTKPGNLPHVEWIDVKSNGVAVECAVMKRDAFGNIYFFEIPSLDRVDKARLTKILHDRYVKNYPLYEYMAQKTMNNGVNMLEYFHQLVRIITPTGKIMSPKMGQIGIPVTGTMKIDQTTETK